MNAKIAKINSTCKFVGIDYILISILMKLNHTFSALSSVRFYSD